MDKLISAEDTQEDKQTVFLSFRNTREKKLTVKAAFIKVFGEALEPLGYKKVKGANPYFVRVIDSEIIHVVTFVTDSTAPGYKAFEICGDVRSIYAFDNYFSKKPEDAYSGSYFDLSNFRVYSYRLHHEDYDFDYQRKISRFLCKDDSASIISKMNEALDTSQKILLPFINSIDSVDKLFKYLFRYHPSSLYNRRELLFLRIGNYSEAISDIRRTVNDVYLKCIELKRDGYTEEDYKRKADKACQVDQRRRNAIKEVRDDPMRYAEYKNKEEEAKEKTIRVLKEYEII